MMFIKLWVKSAVGMQDANRLKMMEHAEREYFNQKEQKYQNCFGTFLIGTMHIKPDTTLLT